MGLLCFCALKSAFGKFEAGLSQKMYMFFEKDVHVLAKRCTCFGKNIYMFWRAAASKILEGEEFWTGRRGVLGKRGGVFLGLWAESIIFAGVL